MYIFLHKKKINFLSSSSFKICKMYTFDPYFLARNHEYFLIFSFAHFVGAICALTSY